MTFFTMEIKVRKFNCSVYKYKVIYFKNCIIIKLFENAVKIILKSTAFAFLCLVLFF